MPALKLPKATFGGFFTQQQYDFRHNVIEDERHQKLMLIVVQLEIAIQAESQFNGHDKEDILTKSHKWLLHAIDHKKDNEILEGYVQTIIRWYFGDDNGNGAKENLFKFTSSIYVNKADNITSNPSLSHTYHPNIIRRHSGMLLLYAAVLASCLIISASLIAITATAVAPLAIMGLAVSVLSVIMGLKIMKDEKAFKVHEDKVNQYDKFLEGQTAYNAITTGLYDKIEPFIGYFNKQDHDPSKREATTTRHP